MLQTCLNAIKSVKAGITNLFGAKSQNNAISPFCPIICESGYYVDGKADPRWLPWMLGARLDRIRSFSDIELFSDRFLGFIDPFCEPGYYRWLLAANIKAPFLSMTMFDLYDAIEGRTLFYQRLFSQPFGGIKSEHGTPTLLIAHSKPDAICTLCAKVESPGFFTGCLLNDVAKEDVPPCEYTCDGNGNLFLKRSQ